MRYGLVVLRDGVTGNTSGFELEDEGSTPSPAANLKLSLRAHNDLASAAAIQHGWLIRSEIKYVFDDQRR